MGALFAVALIFLGGIAGARGASPLAEMDHTTWTARDGAPQGILSLAQAPDGILWIAAYGGLFSFDGHAFHEFRSPPGQPDLPAGVVRSVFVARDGTIWAGFLSSGVARIGHGKVTLYDKADKDRIIMVQNMHQSADGTLWALASETQIIRFGSDGAWHQEPTPTGKEEQSLQNVFFDSSDTLWVAQGGRLYRRPLAQSRYYPTDAEVEWPFGFAEAPDGSIWVSDVITAVDHGRTQHVDRSGKVLEHLTDDTESFQMAGVPGGTVVMATQYKGLRSFPASAPPGMANYLHTDGLSSDSMHALLVDADGNLWAGGSKGLDRFRKARLVPFVTKSAGGEWSLCSGQNGDVWVADNSKQLYRVSGGTVQTFPDVGDIYSAHCGTDGEALVVDHTGFWQAHDGKLSHLPPVPKMAPYDAIQIAGLPDHTLYASVTLKGPGSGLWQYKDEQWTQLVRKPPFARPPVYIYVDSKGRLWAAYPKGRIGLPVESKLFSSGTPGVGIVYTLLETSYGMLAAGQNGAALLRGDRLQMLSFQDRLAARDVGGMAESGNGDLWLNATHGIVHIRAADLKAWLGDPRKPMKTEIVTEGDFVGPARPHIGAPMAGRDDKGNIWFATMNGVLHFDPEHLDSESRPPILSMRSVAAGGKSLAAGARIGPRPEPVDFQYLGVNLTAPESVIYRTRLDGFDDDWQEAGHRTEAIYPHLGPGTYTFRVSASNGNGVWTEPVSAASFTVLPSFYQTTWFMVLAGLAGLVLLWFLYTMRIGSVSRAIRARAEERADERIRISRDLHDTLLQGIQGLLLTFHVAAQKVSPDADSKAMLEHALSTADKIIIEGRNRLNSLRSEHLSDSELIGSLENVGRDLRIGDEVLYQVVRSGGGGVLHSHVADEVFYMAREALTNAFRHSKATEIRLELDYGTRLFAMRCRDNGCGFEKPEEPKAGRWGLKGLYERAQNLGGKLECDTAPGKGTEIVFILAPHRAYRNYSRLAYYLGRNPFAGRDAEGS